MGKCGRSPQTGPSALTSTCTRALQAGTRVPGSRPCLSASSFHEPSLAESGVQPLGPDGHLSLTPRGEQESPPQGSDPGGLGARAAPKAWGTGEIVEPSRGLFTSPASFTVGEPARAPPGGLYPRGRHATSDARGFSDPNPALKGRIFILLAGY